ncbi:MAG: histidine phosphatase family protein [Oleispira sp.]|nr:histidine phosphatase family protein [Oleispira sp.]MBL4880022.1 histidine phosphatase family protein [Oleispira sp.]
MASIYLVRHGQAGFNKLDYDQLSDLGHQQAEYVGKSLDARSIEAGLVIHGAMKRHRETMQGAQKKWHSYGTVIEQPGFNEFDSDDVIAAAHPQFSSKTLEKIGFSKTGVVQKITLGAYLATQKNPQKAFQILFASAIERWSGGQYDEEYIESWTQFTKRCRDALMATIEQAAGKDVVVFTSGGPITAIAQYCLGLDNEHAFKLNWSLVNGGITQLLYNQQGKVSLASCNEQEHLIRAGKTSLTYR